MFDWHSDYFKTECAELAHTRGTMATLAAFANFDTMQCFPSQSTLARLTGQSVETVRRHIKLNIAAGWLKQVSRGTSHRQASVYEFLIPEATAQVSSTPLTHEGSSEATPLTHEGSTPLTGDRPTTHASTHGGELHPAKETTHQDCGHEGRSGESGPAFADREVEASGDGPLTSGQHVAGTDQGNPTVSNANEHEDYIRSVIESVAPPELEAAAPW